MRIEDYALAVPAASTPHRASPRCWEEKHGRWLISPAGEVRSVSSRYREGTLVLETDLETAGGTAGHRLHDWGQRR